MKSLNKITLLSTVTRDGELKEVAAGKSVYTFGLVTNRVWKDAKGEKQTLSEFHNIICWGELAVFAGQYVKKGKPLYIEGYLKTRACETADGIRRYHIEIIVENISGRLALAAAQAFGNTTQTPQRMPRMYNAIAPTGTR